jgi:hypothetical protein
MIYCPKCGTANREGSRFCNECGQELGTQTRIKCPECGAMNSVQNVFCDACGGRLLPSPSEIPGAEAGLAIKGLSLPTKPPASEEEAPDEGEASEPAADVPAWLRVLGDSWYGEAEESGEVPDWLQDLHASLPDQDPDEEQDPEGDIPAHTGTGHPLVGEREPELDTSVSEDSQGEEVDDYDDWIDEAGMAEGEAEAPGGGEEDIESPERLEAQHFSALGEEEEMFDNPTEEAQEETETFIGPEEVSHAEDAPTGIDPSEIEEEAEVPVAAGEEVRTPDWLVALGLVGAREEGTATSDADEEWEKETPGSEGDPSPEEAATEPAAGESALPEAELPDWLEALRPPETEEEVLSGADLSVGGEAPDWLVLSEEDEGEEGGLARADIPAWLLALKPIELREDEDDLEEEAPCVEEAPEESGLLAGLIGTLPIEMLIAQPRAVTALTKADLPPSDTPQARLFAEIVRRPPESTPKPVTQAPVSWTSRLPLWIVYLVLIAAVTVPLLVGEPLLVRPADPLPSVEALYRGIESLEAGSPVLVAFDYDPTTSGEMDVLARTVVEHLMDREARVVAVSLLPAGPAVAEMVLDEAARDRPKYAADPGQLYANLGYLPGEVAAVRLLGQSMETALPRDFRSTPLAELAAVEGVADIQSFAHIIELAATQETLRWWVEQAGTPYDVPLSAGVSASVGPIARAYYETGSRQLEGLIAGVPGVAEYEALRSNQDVLIGPTAVRLDAQLAGHLVFVLVLVVGAVVQLTRRESGRGQ